MKTKICTTLLIITLTYSSQSQNTLPPSTVNGDLKIKGGLNINDNYFIKTTAANLETHSPLVVTFSPKPTDGDKPYQQPCGPFEFPVLYNNNGQALANPPVAYNYRADILQLSGAWQSNPQSLLNIGLFNDDGIISVEKTSSGTNYGKLRLNPGCVNDVELCEGGGFTKIFGSASVGTALRVGSGAFNGGIGVLTVNATGASSSVFKLTNPTLSPANKTIFDVNGSGKMIAGNQNGMLNTAMVNINVAGASTATDAFDIFDQYSNKVNFRVKSNGVVYSREVNVQLTNFPDFVFDKNYKLKSLENLDAYIQQNHHLPNVPTAAEVETNGANLGELSKIQMEKIEELTLYVIELKKEIELLKTEIKKQKR